MFDPYHQWLSIRKEDQPPTHYRLLGIEPGERSRSVIDHAARRQAGHIRKYQAGKHAEHAVRIWNEIKLARDTLLDPAKRAAYEAELGITADAPTTLAPIDFSDPRKSTASGNSTRTLVVTLFATAAVAAIALVWWIREPAERGPGRPRETAQVDRSSPNEEHGADADALASALSVLGPRRGLALIDRIPESACLITRQTAHGIERFVSCRWSELRDGR